MSFESEVQQETRHPDIIILSLIRWDGPISSTPFALAKEFSLNSRVFYINHPQSIKDLLRKGTPPLKSLSVFRNKYEHPVKGCPCLVCLATCITIPVNFLPSGKVYSLVSKMNDRIVFHLIRRLIKEFHIKQYIFINAFDPFYARRFPKDLPAPIKKIYYALDDISEVPYTARHGMAHELEIAHTYDLVLASSRLIRDHFRKLNAHTELLQNAADTSLFNRVQTLVLQQPVEMNGKTRLVIGYTGSLDYRTDFELLLAVAKIHADKTICLVGPVFTDEVHTSGLSALKNVLFCGTKSLEELPAFLQYMDCMIIPFKCNKLTRSIYPLKINEYLAAGKPVVSTGFSPDIIEFNALIGIASSIDSFNSLIQEAIESDSKEKIAQRMKVSSLNSWEKRVSEFWEIVQKF